MPLDHRKMPSESLHLHIKDFELNFASNSRQPSTTYACVRKAIGKVLFVQVYLVTVRQFELIVSMLSQTQISKLPDKLAVGKSAAIKEARTFYSSVLKLCQLEGLDVMCLNCDWES
jgi:hypothetical protein